MKTLILRMFSVLSVSAGLFVTASDLNVVNEPIPEPTDAYVDAERAANILRDTLNTQIVGTQMLERSSFRTTLHMNKGFMEVYWSAPTTINGIEYPEEVTIRRVW